MPWQPNTSQNSKRCSSRSNCCHPRFKTQQLKVRKIKLPFFLRSNTSWSVDSGRPTGSRWWLWGARLSSNKARCERKSSSPCCLIVSQTRPWLAPSTRSWRSTKSDTRVWCLLGKSVRPRLIMPATFLKRMTRQNCSWRCFWKSVVAANMPLSLHPRCSSKSPIWPLYSTTKLQSSSFGIKSLRSSPSSTRLLHNSRMNFCLSRTNRLHFWRLSRI